MMLLRIGSMFAVLLSCSTSLFCMFLKIETPLTVVTAEKESVTATASAKAVRAHCSKLILTESVRELGAIVRSIATPTPPLLSTVGVDTEDSGDDSDSSDDQKQEKMQQCKSTSVPQTSQEDITAIQDLMNVLDQLTEIIHSQETQSLLTSEVNEVTMNAWKSAIKAKNSKCLTLQWLGSTVIKNCKYIFKKLKAINCQSEQMLCKQQDEALSYLFEMLS